MITQVSLLLMAVAVTIALPYAPPAPGYQAKPLMPYAFEYGVSDYNGNNFARKEHSDGNKVQGSYSVLLPDGRLQTVNYNADKHNGFVADVQYSGAQGHQQY